MDDTGSTIIEVKADETLTEDRDYVDIEHNDEETESEESLGEHDYVEVEAEDLEEFEVEQTEGGYPEHLMHGKSDSDDSFVMVETTNVEHMTYVQHDEQVMGDTTDVQLDSQEMAGPSGVQEVQAVDMVSHDEPAQVQGDEATEQPSMEHVEPDMEQEDPRVYQHLQSLDDQENVYQKLLQDETEEDKPEEEQEDSEGREDSEMREGEPVGSFEPDVDDEQMGDSYQQNLDLDSNRPRPLFTQQMSGPYEHLGRQEPADQEMYERLMPTTIDESTETAEPSLFSSIDETTETLEPLLSSTVDESTDIQPWVSPSVDENTDTLDLSEFVPQFDRLALLKFSQEVDETTKSEETEFFDEVSVETKVREVKTVKMTLSATGDVQIEENTDIQTDTELTEHKKVRQKEETTMRKKVMSEDADASSLSGRGDASSRRGDASNLSGRGPLVIDVPAKELLGKRGSSLLSPGPARSRSSRSRSNESASPSPAGLSPNVFTMSPKTPLAPPFTPPPVWSQSEADSSDLGLFVAVMAYEPENEDVMSLHEGEMLEVMNDGDDDWWKVRKTFDQREGFVPKAYLQEKKEYETKTEQQMFDVVEQLAFENSKSQQQNASHLNYSPLYQNIP